METTTGWALFADLGTLGWVDDEAYLCGVGDTVGDSRWFTLGDDGRFVDSDGLWSFALSGDTVELNGPDASFTSDADDLSNGALYDLADPDCRSGAVLADGFFVGAWCAGGAAYAQVEPIETIVGIPDTIPARLVSDPGVVFDFERVP